MSELELLRAQIDEIDERLIELLAERFAVTREVGRLKAAASMPPIDARREAEIDAKARRLATAYGLDGDLVAEVLRAVIDRVVAEHRLIADGSEGG
jgi:chorismate mutase